MRATEFNPSLENIRVSEQMVTSVKPRKDMATVDIRAMGSSARAAAAELGLCTAEQRDTALRALATALDVESARILVANDADLTAARADGLDEHVVERMMLNVDRIADMATSVRNILTIRSAMF